MSRTPQSAEEIINGKLALKTALNAILFSFTFAILSYLGFFLEEPLHKIINLIGLKHIDFIRKAEVVHSLWLGIVGAHAAVGALAPILGYTLMATSITNASRVAPSGAVIAHEIKWTTYLETSLVLLIASVTGLVSAPSTPGLILAGFSLAYVVTRTIIVFKHGFELIERPEKLDSAARKYLIAAVAGTPASNLNQSLAIARNELNDGLRQRFPGAAHRGAWTIRLGSKFQATQLLAISPNALDSLLSEANRLGLQLHSIMREVPTHLPLGETDFISVLTADSAVSTDANEPPNILHKSRVDTADLYKLQTILSRSIVFGVEKWISDHSRVPMLINRHVATVIYDAIPHGQPHDLDYGLNVLGQIIDEVQSAQDTDGSIRLDNFDWTHQIPRFVCEQILAQPSQRAWYIRHLSYFLRARIIKWSPDGRLDSLSTSYFRLLARLLGGLAATSDESLEFVAVVIREIPLLNKSKRSQIFRIAQRELIIALVDRDNGFYENRTQRRVLIRTMRDLLNFSNGYADREKIIAETVVGAFAIALYMAAEDEIFQECVDDLYTYLLTDNHSPIPFKETLSIASRMDQYEEEWKWSWWEMEQKEPGRAHMVSISFWISRAILLILSNESWKLKSIPDEELPDQQTIGILVRSLGYEWRPAQARSVNANIEKMSGPLRIISDRRSEIVASRVAEASLDKNKVRKYSTGAIQDIESALESYALWIEPVNLVTTSSAPTFASEFGMSRLLPRELFVPDDVLDVKSSISRSQDGSAILEVEIQGAIDSIKLGGVIHAKIANLTDSRPWSYAESLLSKDNRVWIILSGVSEYEVYDQLERLRSRFSPKFFRVDTSRDRIEGKAEIIVIDIDKALVFGRSPPAEPENSVFTSRSSIFGGSAISSISEISGQMKDRWLADVGPLQSAELAKRYEESLVEALVWSFGVEHRDTSTSAIFVMRSSPD